MRRQNLQLTCSLGKGKRGDHEAGSTDEDGAKFLLQRALVLPVLASMVLGSANPAQAAEIDWAALLNPAETIAVPEEPKPAEPPSYKDLLGRLKRDSEEKQEEAAPEPSVEAPAPLSLWERQQKRAQELREKALKVQAEREAAARAVAEQRAAERAEREAREEAERAERARVAAEKEAAARAEREAAIARSKAEAPPAPSPAPAPAKVATPAPPVKEAPQQASVNGKKKTHGFLPLFVAQFLLFAAYGGGILVLFFVPDKELEKVRKPLAEAFERLLELSAQAQPVLSSAVSKGQELAGAAAPVAAKAIEAAKPVAAQAVEASKPLLKQAQEKAKTLVDQAKDNAQKTG